MIPRVPRPCPGVLVALLAALLATWLSNATHAASPLALSEFLASNTKGILDENGDGEDWIELHNTSAQVVNAGGWYLTDDPTVLTKWRMPATNMAPGGFIVVFASAKDRANAGAPLHTNFKLNNQGEYLALVEPDGETVATDYAPEFPPQAPDVSFGLDATGTQRFFATPTPGAINGTGYIARVGDTKFSVDRGFFTNTFELAITSVTDGAEIRYTTNGAPPTASSGTAYSNPIRIDGTTVVRAAAFKPGYLPSNVDSHSYLFTSDIIRQSPTGAPPTNWPTSWGSNSRDYGMDPDVVNDPRYKDKIQPALLSLPSFCINMTLADLFDRTRGIYANAGQDGIAWERPMSLELIYPDGRKGFQIDGGIRIRGGFSRSTDNPKHAFRFFFRPEYGTAKLRYPVFGQVAAEEFEGFDLRTFQNYSWSFQGDSRGTFMRDMFNRDAQLATGSQGERGDYYHLYINGQYWGLYNTCERAEASYGATYYGGAKEDYDVIKVEAGSYVVLATDGTMSAWTTVYNLVKPGATDTIYRRLMGQNPDGTRNPTYPVYLDPVNLIDYMLIILWGGNLDAPISNFLGNTSPNNFFGIWNRTRQDLGFQWFVHDAEHTLLNVNEDRTGPYSAGDSSVTKSSPQWLWQKLLASPEFKVLVRDRVQRHFFNAGPLSANGARTNYLVRKAQIDTAVIGESARWGDAKRASDPFDRDSDWVPAVNANLNFIAQRPAVVLAQLRTDGLWPTTPVPQFNQQGGPVPPAFSLVMSASGSAIYYTLDGSDPRRPGGAVSPSAIPYTSPIPITQSTTVKARILVNNDWSALNEAEFTVIQTFSELALTEIHYHPAPSPDRAGDDFEFVELKNIGGQELDLGGVHFTDGIGFRFPNGARLRPGAFAVLVRNPEAFTNRYPTVPVTGVYTGGLANTGERLSLVHAVGTSILSVAWDTRPPWPELTDGQGFSLVPIQANATSLDAPSAWRASSHEGGSPGSDDPTPGIVPVVINEILTHTDPPLLDTVELHNPTDATANIAGWWLTDDRLIPEKFRIPAGTTIPAHGFLAFSELDFNTPTNATTSFTFSSYGDDVWLFSADAAGKLTGYSDGFHFPASANAVTFGRMTNSAGQLRFPPQILNTLGQPNAGPQIGPVVISEIHYEPAPGGAEFIEIRNITASPVPLFDPLAPTNTWHIEGLGFTFPTNVILPPDGLAVVTPGNPVAFRNQYAVPAEVPVFGPCAGALQDNGETLVLQRPDKPDFLTDGSVFVPYLVVDQVEYNNKPPWPVAAAGQGPSLVRRNPARFGDDPSAWTTSVGDPSPGLVDSSNRPPTADAGPDSEFEAATFPAAVTLNGTGMDDGLPEVPGRLSFLWSQVDGPGAVTLNDATRSNAVVQLPGTGTYLLRLTVSDGERIRSDDVAITVHRPSVQQALVAAGSTWKYLEDGTEPGTAWVARAFDDSQWKIGTAELGYGDGDESTVLAINAGPVKTIAFYFRKTFSVPDPRTITALNVRLVRDDGAMVYLNGTLVFRSNMPEGDVNSQTWASQVVGGADESAFFEQAVDPAVLVAGNNVLAVEVHQSGASSSDVSFNLALDAMTSASNLAPTADAGPDRNTTAGTPTVITGRYTDDGLPSPPGVVTFAWSQLSGPAPAVFDRTNTPATTVNFPSAGNYTLRFVVFDGVLSASDDTTFTVTGSGGGGEFSAWKTAHFSAAELANPGISGDDADPDGDGQSNRNEYLSGTDPRNPASALRVGAVVGADTTVRLTFPVLPGRTYSILSRAAAATGPWEVVSSIEPANCDCPVTVTVPGPTVLSGARFYRVVTPRIAP